ncbi:hypothetical protein [Vibrio marisflavi]|uniref:Uncharacterized protein n=1 Tax=Vibrio marisflavi CECT 7928 TaxID=634439 RepID=A0ABN8E2E4_9VIBR|nr:hypothetical protein [Vibrio marisflavi]CAH0539271.1 hypothetical protein VMF7928_02032 [Vibrio marisflavi CECT 7928]
MIHSVTIIVHIFDSKQQKHLVGYREINLPFAPYIGMSVQSGGVDFGAFNTVTWIELEDRFSCTISYDRQHSAEDLEFIVNEAKSVGYQWTEEESPT